MSKKALKYVADRKKFLSVRSIEKECGITPTSLTNAINRGQSSFKQSDLLIPFLKRVFDFSDDRMGVTDA